MSKFKSVTHQGHHARKYDNATIEQCPYPASSMTSKEWRQGWNKANKGEPWEEPRRRVKNYE